MGFRVGGWVLRVLLGLRLELPRSRYLWCLVSLIVFVYERFRLLVVGIPGCEVWCMTSRMLFIIRYD